MAKRFTYQLCLFLCILLTGCEDSCNGYGRPDRPDKPVIIMFENDVHCAVDGYARLAAVRSGQYALTPYVATVSCGDFVQGGVVGSVTRGEAIVDIMNRVGYDVVVPGNHEFDYGMEQLRMLDQRLEAEIVCANFRDRRTGAPVFSPFHMISYGEVDIAFVGLTTTTTNVTGPTFRDERDSIAYTFSPREELYSYAQRAVDEARRAGADYVVALMHLGDVDWDEGHPSSVSVIANTTGIDVALDGHDHHVISDSTVLNRNGEPVLLASTGTQLEYAGVLVLDKEGTFSTYLVGLDNFQSDSEIQSFVDEIKEENTSSGDRVVCTNAQPLSIYDGQGNRLVRIQETAIGNFCADAFRQMAGTDIALLNGGGLRNDLPQGELTYNDLLNLMPFGNVMSTGSLTGQQLLDALEVGVRVLPEENGGFMQVSGLKMEVDSTVASPVVLDENDLFVKVQDNSPRRVGNVLVLNRESGIYEPIAAERTYTVATFNYILTEMGGEGCLRYATTISADLGRDTDVMAAYIATYLGGHIGEEDARMEGRIVMK